MYIDATPLIDTLCLWLHFYIKFCCMKGRHITFKEFGWAAFNGRVVGPWTPRAVATIPGVPILMSPDDMVLWLNHLSNVCQCLECVLGPLNLAARVHWIWSRCWPAQVVPHPRHLVRLWYLLARGRVDIEHCRSRSSLPKAVRIEPLGWCFPRGARPIQRVVSIPASSFDCSCWPHTLPVIIIYNTVNVLIFSRITGTIIILVIHLLWYCIAAL